MPKLLVTLPDGSEVTHDLTEPVITLGRLDENSLHVDDPSVSSRHAQLTVQESGHYLLRDLNSTNGTRVNGERIAEEVALQPGTRVRFGKVEAVYEPNFLADAGDVPVPALTGAADGDAVPAPQAVVPVAAVAEKSHRPADFANSAPFKKQEKTRDPVGRAMLAFAGVAFLLFFVALFYIFRLQPPGGLPG